MNLILFFLMCLAWIIPTLGAVMEALLGLVQLFCLFAMIKKRKSFDHRARGMLKYYLISIVLYAFIALIVLYYLRHGSFNLTSFFHEYFILFLFFGPPIFFAGYFIYFLKYVLRRCQ